MFSKWTWLKISLKLKQFSHIHPMRWKSTAALQWEHFVLENGQNQRNDANSSNYSTFHQILYLWSQTSSLMKQNWPCRIIWCETRTNVVRHIQISLPATMWCCRSSHITIMKKKKKVLPLLVIVILQEHQRQMRNQ